MLCCVFSKYQERTSPPWYLSYVNFTSNGTLYYFADFLRVAKYRAAAIIIIAQPPIVKIVVPIPPVDGREDNLVFGMSVTVTPSPFVTFFNSVTVPVLVLVWVNASEFVVVVSLLRYAGTKILPVSTDITSFARYVIAVSNL